MDPFRLASLLTDLEARQRQGLPVGDDLCLSATELVGVHAAGITLITESGHYGAFGASGPLAHALEDLQYTLGEGPCIDAHNTRQPVHEPDLENPAQNRWPTYRDAAIARGVRAVFGFPLLQDGESLGALDLYQEHRGALRDEQAADAAIMCEVVTHTVLALQADVPVGTLAPELGVAFDHHAVLHQASGLVAGELGLPLPDAYVRIRAHAYTHGRPVTEVATAIVRRELRLS